MEVKVDSAQSTIRATVARALAEALILGIDQCSQEKHELSQLQQIDLATMSIMSYDNALESCELIALDAEISNRWPL